MAMNTFSNSQRESGYSDIGTEGSQDIFSYSHAEKAQLLAIARESIKTGLVSGEPSEIDLTSLPRRLKEKRASFVTLNKQRQLRGCIGHIEPTLPLAVDVAQNAWSAATQDSRFQPLKLSELDDVSISISVLSLPQPLKFQSEQELLAMIQPGTDGLILEAGYRRGVFLPSVWESVQNRQEFLRQLKLKAGLPVDFWSDQVKVSVFHTLYFSEQDAN